MAKSTLWMVRAGKGGNNVALFRSGGFVGIGWIEAGDIPPDTDPEEIQKRIDEQYPASKDNARAVWAAQIRRFLQDVRIGDGVLTFDPEATEYLLGLIDSEPYWVEGAPLGRRRKVAWTHRIPKERLFEATTSSLGAIQTFFKVPEDAASDVHRHVTPLEGGTASTDAPVDGIRLTFADFDVLARHQQSTPWREIPDSDRSAIGQLRQTLLDSARFLKSTLTCAVPLQAFASHPNPSGRNALYYWSCVYPADVPKKAFGFQLFVIIKPESVEFGFGAGAGKAEMKDLEAHAALERVFEAAQQRLDRLRDSEWMRELGAAASRAGYQFRSRWLREVDDSQQFGTIQQWIDHAKGPDGGGAAISRFWSRQEALELGDQFAQSLATELQLFVPILEGIYAAINETPAPVDPRPAISRPQLTLEWLMSQTLWQRDRLEEVIESLRGRSPQVALAGPPGTGKTWVAQLIARYLTQDRPDAIRTVQFHPSYAYEEFMEGLRPVSGAGGISFERCDGVVLSVVDSMKGNASPTIILIDEMNRANLPKVFGELMYLFEYRGHPIDLAYSRGFQLPPDLWFIGTMNTADRSIRSIDIALRRRFDIFECPPDPDVLTRFYESGPPNEVADLIEGFEKLNRALTTTLDRHHTIGHAFFMNNDGMTRNRLLKVWRHKIGPLIEEYLFDQPDVAATFIPEVYWSLADA